MELVLENIVDSKKANSRLKKWINIEKLINKRPEGQIRRGWIVNVRPAIIIVKIQVRAD